MRLRDWEKVQNRTAIGSGIYRKIFWILLSCSLFVSGSVTAQSLLGDGALETSLASAYLYLANKTTWPAESLNSPFVFCVNREHQLFEAFQKLLPTRKLFGFPIEQRFFEKRDNEVQRKCNLIALSKQDDSQHTIMNVDGMPILTISHEIDISEINGLVYLAHDSKLQPPKINFRSLEKSGLRIDATVLDLSKRRWGNGS